MIIKGMLVKRKTFEKLLDYYTIEEILEMPRTTELMPAIEEIEKDEPKKLLKVR